MAPDELEKVRKIRRRLMDLSRVEAAKTLVEQLEKFPTNKDWLAAIR